MVSLFALAVAACGGSPSATFDLSPASGATGRAGRGQLAVSEPVAISPFDSERIVVRAGAGADQVAYLKGAQWTDRLPRLLQSRLVQTFENGRLLRAVGRSGDKIAADYSLTSEIRHFEIDVATSTAVVEISAKLVSEQTGRIRAARIFRAQVPGSAADGAQASVALDAALSQVMREIVRWASAAM
ncbi:MAG: hypothetical protein BGP04_04950 [Rhizobiales bacterium 62-17]|nr:MAG: hypothetical protein BGP04_04950 [Rhizobiales bacterium 62-17]